MNVHFIFFDMNCSHSDIHLLLSSLKQKKKISGSRLIFADRIGLWLSPRIRMYLFECLNLLYNKNRKPILYFQ